jgi:hypothetical protein
MRGLLNAEIPSLAADRRLRLEPSAGAQVGSSAVIVADGPNVGQRFYYQPIGSAGWHCQVVPSGSC